MQEPGAMQSHAIPINSGAAWFLGAAFLRPTYGTVSSVRLRLRQNSKQHEHVSRFL